MFKKLPTITLFPAKHSLEIIESVHFRKHTHKNGLARELPAYPTRIVANFPEGVSGTFTLARA